MKKRTLKGIIEPDDAKLGELVLYIARRSEEDQSFGAVKLNKLLWLADFIAFGRHGRPITGQVYQKLENGPAPRRLLPVRNKLVAKGYAATQERQVFERPQKRTIALREPDLSRFSGVEIALVEGIITEAWGKSAAEMSDESHIFPGWKAAEIGETIPYETVFLSERRLTEKERRYGLEIEATCRG